MAILASCLIGLTWQNEQYKQDNGVKFSYTKIAKLHHKVTNTHKKNYLHQIPHRISKNHAMIYIESLQATNYQGDAENTVKRETKIRLKPFNFSTILA
ncbi:hypothetical protein [Haemophilus influenzae]|uniref:hypothetical protein n=1 Tax=Haemophilus influenzae TaxID=727 RepID=UPI000680DD91|nr:hypothetical protein [Haemophilus influenzae]KMZ15730.1 hypothetical protein ABN40_01990 [Haemophilus influenzae]KMZ16031.1 hypothetical protein ABN79_06260 [Haemophilus influenzae]